MLYLLYFLLIEAQLHIHKHHIIKLWLMSPLENAGTIKGCLVSSYPSIQLDTTIFF